MNTLSVLTLDKLGYSYDSGKNSVLKNVTYSFEKGKLYAIVGKSGAGKTTLLSLLSGLTLPTEGSIVFDGKDLRKTDRYQYRSRHVGVIFQSFNLLSHLTAEENVVMSMDVSGKKTKAKKEKAALLLQKVDLDSNLARRRVLKLSGGEQQRVAIARALSYDPEIILADEPTGNLDVGTQQEVINIFKNLAHDENKCVILVTHSPEVAAAVDEVYQLAPFGGKKQGA